jgi:hypothetical protein
MSLLDKVKEKLGFEDKRPLHVIVKEKAVKKPEAAYDDIGLGPYHPFVNKDTENRARQDTKMAPFVKKPTTSMSRSTFVQVYDRAKNGSKSAKELMDNLGVDTDKDSKSAGDLYDNIFGSKD